MDPVRNPYSPGAGRPPAALVGRDAEIEAWRVAVERIQLGRSAQPVCLYGLRGVGKTVLLNVFRRAAFDRDWITAHVEASREKPLRDSLADALRIPLTDLAGKPSVGQRVLQGLKTFGSFRVVVHPGGEVSFGIDLSAVSGGGGADSGELEADLTKLTRDLSWAAAEQGVGLALFLDEAQDLTDDELEAVCGTVHHAEQNGWPVVFAVAGLPSLPRVLAEAKSYAERLFNFSRIDELPVHLARDAITQPSYAEGVDWDAAAVDLVVEATGGYPYFLQQYGQDTWNVAEATDPPVIGLWDARLGAQRAQTALDDGIYRVRWDRATPTEQQYLRTMAEDGEAGSSSGAIARRMNRRLSSVGPMRSQLISKGLVYVPDHGRVAFTIPGMADFISRQARP